MEPSREKCLRMSWPEFVLRLVLAAVLLLAVDAIARQAAPADRVVYDATYRLPKDSSLDGIGPLVQGVRKARAENPKDLIVVFLGASPAYGIGIKDPANTFAAAFERAANAATTLRGRRVRAFNLAANGLLIGDQYVIAKAIGDAADLYVVQLTYQTFDPTRSRSRMREPDLPAMLHVPLGPDEARALGSERRTDTALDRAIDEAVRDRWFALRDQREIASALGLDDAPKRLYRLASGVGAAPSTEDVPSGDGESDGEGLGASGADPTTPFDELDPALQMVAISRAGENSAFDLDASNAELGMLRRIAGFVRSNGRDAVFFLSPMNEDIIAAYGVLDEAQYQRNVDRIRAAVDALESRLIDYHSEPFLTSIDFVDLTHTTDSGGSLTGERLWKDLRSTVESLPAR